MSTEDGLEHKNSYVWLTQSSSQISAYIELLIELGYNYIHIPLLNVKPIACDLPNDSSAYQAIILTSANSAHALKALDHSFAHIPVYTVGDQTAQSVRTAGFEKVISAAADLSRLEEIMAADLSADDGQLLYFSGKEISRMPAMTGFNIDRHICYEMQCLEDLPHEINELITDDRLTAVTAFSQRAGLTLSALLDRHVRALHLDSKISMIKALCLSDKVLNSIDKQSFKAVRVADTPNQYGMLNMMKSELEIS